MFEGLLGSAGVRYFELVRASFAELELGLVAYGAPETGRPVGRLTICDSPAAWVRFADCAELELSDPRGAAFGRERVEGGK